MRKVFKTAVLVCTFLMPILSKAQPPTFDDESPYGVTDVPFDDGVFVLVAIAIAYGLLRMWTYKKALKSKKVVVNS